VSGSFGIYFTGIGGTGVITANRILAAGAEAAGLAVGGMDQTGLSQKAGAVVSHLHLALDRRHLASAVISVGGADLYLSGDILQAAAGRHLDKVEPGRTLAVVDRELTPTSGMLQTGAAANVVALEREIVERVGSDRVVFVESKQLAEALLGNHLLANVVLLGAAYQLGGLPMSIGDIEAGIGAAAEGSATSTREAFEWGRWAVHDPRTVRQCVAAARLGGAHSTGLFEPSGTAVATAAACLGHRRMPVELGDLLTRRTAQVIDYQNVPLANTFLDLVELVASRDNPAYDWELTRVVTDAWFRLLTYKDEYEVARLHLKADYGRVAGELGIEGPYRVTYHLHPPVLRRMGLQKKLPMARPYEVAFRALRGMKRLRGTRFDVFGWDRDRRTERTLIEDYDRLVREVTDPRLGVAYERKVAVARSVGAIKGYGPVKEAAVERWRNELDLLLPPAPAPAPGRR
jgi:indolepyruvate ferredoxin oxidoreductase